MTPFHFDKLTHLLSVLREYQRGDVLANQVSKALRQLQKEYSGRFPQYLNGLVKRFRSEVAIAAESHLTPESHEAADTLYSAFLGELSVEDALAFDPEPTPEFNSQFSTDFPISELTDTQDDGLQENFTFDSEGMYDPANSLDDLEDHQESLDSDSQE